MLSELIDILVRGVRLRCPCCGYGPLFQRGFRLHDRCLACDERFEREPGQWFGAVYVNIGLTMVVVTTGFAITRCLTPLSLPQQLWIWTPVAAVSPVAFFRLSKGVWTSLVFHGEGLYIPWPNR